MCASSQSCPGENPNEYICSDHFCKLAGGSSAVISKNHRLAAANYTDYLPHEGHDREFENDDGAYYTRPHVCHVEVRLQPFELIPDLT